LGGGVRLFDQTASRIDLVHSWTKVRLLTGGPFGLDARRRTLNGQPHNVAPDAMAPALIEFFAG
jgi:hypothetical protein